MASGDTVGNTAFGKDVQALLGLRVPPIGIGFLQSPPPNVPAWQGKPVPAGCTFWAEAQRGNVFYTTPADHYNCAIGARTHKITLPLHRADELPQTIGLMVQNNYLAMDEVAGIPTLETPPAVIAYGPVEKIPFAPSVVLALTTPAQAMLLYEAAVRAGAAPTLMAALGRPGCAVLPLALQTGAASLSLGCAGNREFTQIPPSEFYVSVPGEKWNAVVEELARVHEANAAMDAFYSEKHARFAVA